ncbi:unnamed protein product [Triticum turgidum subsp. durum]|uniref:Exosome complex component CSL4 C-terminal domain-containing protein n=1 Tax=Triticum turgidum subsp. durum TaxID=4567 RepID=A0A9R1APW5_TRITD|nr:unnamed protein product [Triticum turgidum subsp. durum]
MAAPRWWSPRGSSSGPPRLSRPGAAPTPMAAPCARRSPAAAASWPPPPAPPTRGPRWRWSGTRRTGPCRSRGASSLPVVTKVMARMASADIMCVDSKAVKEKFTGMIRQQDVRATEIDKVDMYQSYRPGDIVRALVLSLGDARAYYLSTAKNELGVVSAQSIAGGTLVPTSWTEMQCELTGQIEQRKVAKVE